MTFFVRSSPQQWVLETAEQVQYDFNLTDEEMVIVLLDILKYFLDPTDRKSHDLQQKEERPR